MSQFNDSNIEREVLDRLVRIEVKLDSFESAKNTSYENQRQIIELRKDTEDQEKRISSIEDNNTWLKRTTVGAVIASAVGFIFGLIQLLMQ